MIAKRRLAGMSAPIFDVLAVAFVIPAGLLLKLIRRYGLQRLYLCGKALQMIGILPVRDHYYEPYPKRKDFRYPLSDNRPLPGISWNIEEQLALLDLMDYEAELEGLMDKPGKAYDFRLGNRSFESGDAEYLYQLLRLKRPRRLIEIGSGQSTLIARSALERNGSETGTNCIHICIEPYEAPWLEMLGVRVVRQRVEEVDIGLFEQLEENDVLFIDSSHVLKPQGDVVCEYLNILPRLQRGVIVHVHDIFSPRDYPAEWVIERMWLWNEQYMLEAFLTNNQSWKIVGALNFLAHNHFERLKRVCPYLSRAREPGSFYIQKTVGPSP